MGTHPSTKIRFKDLVKANWQQTVEGYAKSLRARYHVKPGRNATAELYAAIMRDPKVPEEAKMLRVHLGLYAFGKKSRCNPGDERLQAEMNIEYRNLKGRRATLRQAKVIAFQERDFGPNRYTLVDKVRLPEDQDAE